MANDTISADQEKPTLDILSDFHCSSKPGFLRFANFSHVVYPRADLENPWFPQENHPQLGPYRPIQVAKKIIELNGPCSTIIQPF
jgi:hypothetical protein